ncbi:hypothetical protein AB3G45_24350 [Shinella sp. S4-D37]|uniref:hypothetical protein n=1 Tax=Shinella sp. S4-D37 TaxID=3161999 RepID=UPI003466053C
MAKYVNPNNPISLAKYERPVVDRSSLVVVKFPPKAPLSAKAAEALKSWGQGADALADALALTEGAVERMYRTATLLMYLSAMNYEVETGRRLNTEAAIDAAFDSPAINFGGWMRIGNKNQVVRACEHFVNPDSPISLKKDDLPTISLAKTPTARSKSPAEALAWFFDCIDHLHANLARTDDNAVAALYVAVLRIYLAANDYEILSGNKLTPEAAVQAAFANREINVGCWRRDGNHISQDFAAYVFGWYDDEEEEAAVA